MTKLSTFVLLATTTFAFSQSEPPLVITPKQDKFVILANAGPAFRLGKLPSHLSRDEREYLKKLKSGFSFNLSGYYLSDQNTGYGLKFSSFSSSGEMGRREILDPNGQVGMGYPSDNITITFIGPAAMIQDRGFNKNDRFGLELALGYIGYVNKATVLYDYKLSGSNLGISTAFNYHFGITDKISFGPSVAFTGGVLKKFTISGNGINQTVKLPDNQAETLYRFDLSLGIRIAL